MDRRTFLSLSAATVAGLGLGGLSGCGGNGEPSAEGADNPSPTGASTSSTGSTTPTLGPADVHGLRLLPGFTARLVATTGMLVPGTGTTWHTDPDGGACFAQDDGGWIYVSNSESEPGGASSLRFAADGSITAAARILDGTVRNCAGGATPWSTWLSCEEHADGLVWECDPTGTAAAVRRPGLGVFRHEAVCADPGSAALYLTEDEPDGAFYRFTPARWGDLGAGVLEVMVESSPGDLRWVEVPDPERRDASARPTRSQVPGTRAFNGGEGTCRLGDGIAFTTKGDDKVWRYDPSTADLRVLYDPGTAADPILSGVDNCIALGADLFVCEDGGDMQVIRLRSDGSVQAVVQVAGNDGSEITGVAFSPDGRRMYFSSQRNPGATYEVAGAW